MKKYKLQEVCYIEKGKQIDTSELNDKSPYKYINGGIKESGYYHDFNTSGEVVLVSEGGASCGFVNYITENFWCGCHCYRLTKSKVLPKYLYYALKGNQDKIMRLRSGAAMPNIKKETFKNLIISLDDDKNVQNSVVSSLDTIQTAIDGKKTQLLSLDELVKSRFIEMFADKGFPCERWENVVTIINGKDYKKVPNENQTYPIYGSGGYMGIRCDKYLCNEFSTIIGRKGNVTNPLFVKEKFWNVDTAFGIEVGERLNPYYFYHHTLTIDLASMVSGAAIPSLTKTDLQKLQIPIPPIELQNEFAEFVKLIDKSKFIVQQQIKDLQELLDSKMDEYFR